MTVREFLQARWRWVALFTFTAVLALVMTTTDRVMERRALADERGRARDDAAILASGLRSELEKFTLVPVALADDPTVAAVLAQQASPDEMNRRLETLALQSKAAAIYITDRSGLTRAASNWNLPTSFVGANYGFRRYFRQAITEGGGTQFALGTVSRRPGLYIARRVGSPERPLGIVAVKVEFDASEQTWRNTTRGVYVTDKDGVVLLASRPEWRFKAVDPSALGSRDVTADRRQFGVARFEKLALPSTGRLAGTVATPLVEAEQPVPPIGWTLHLLVDPTSGVANSVTSGRLALLLFAALVAAVATGTLFQRKRREAAAEAILTERTRTLREQLSQANRLATLGQVTAGVSHEISQPIAATRVFAENGRKLLDGGRSSEAALSFDRIVGLTEKMGRITDELRRFSRRQPGERRSMPVGEVIEGALLLLRDRIVQARADIRRPGAELESILVRAEHVRLEQVLVNLLQNALDATSAEGVIDIAIEAQEERILLSVSDDGPGISKEREATLFQPFATSKPQGLGLGLVISRDIMRELDGDLSYRAGHQGARFTMTIPRAR